MVQNPSASAEDTGLIPGSGRSPGKKYGNPLQYFLPGKSHRQGNLAGYSLWGGRVRYDLATKITIYTCIRYPPSAAHLKLSQYY